MYEEVVGHVDRRDARTDGSMLTMEQCSQWVEDRRELVEAIAMLFSLCEPMRDESRQIERCLREALDALTGGTTAAHAVSAHYRQNDPPPPYD